MSDLYHLSSLSEDSAPALTLGQALPKTVNGQPAFYYWRKSARDGKYIHPTKGFELSITAERRKAWANNIKEANRAGVEIPVVEDHKESASNTLGYVIDARNNGEWYEELHQYLGQSACDLALRNKISIGIDPDFKDGTGKRYGESVRHSAVTPIPVIPGTGDAEPLFASRGAAVDSDLFLPAALLDRSANMALLEKIREVFGAAELTEDGAIAKMKEIKTSLATATNDLKLSREAHDADKVKLEKAEGRVLELSSAKDDDKQPDPELLMDRADLTYGRIDLSVSRGDMPKFVGDKLKAAIKKDGKASAFMLSRHPDTGNERVADFLIDLFRDSKLGVAADGKSKTGIQMSRQIPDDNAEPKLEDNELIKIGKTL